MAVLMTASALPGRKASQNQAEEQHPLMWFSAVRAELCNTADAAIDEANVRHIFALYKSEHPTLTITENKKNLIVSVICKVPIDAVRLFQDHLQDRTWDRSGLNQTLLGAKELWRDYVPPGCAGAWATMLRNNPTVCADIASFICRQFLMKLCACGKEERSAKRGEILAARCKDQELVSLQAACALFRNWLRPQVADKEPWALGVVDTAWADGMFLQELYRISQSKVSASFVQNLTYQGVSSLAALLRQHKVVCGPLSGEHKKKLMEGKRTEFASLRLRINDIQDAFVQFIETCSGQLMEAAMDRMDVMTTNSERYSAVCEEFCSAHVRIVCLDGPAALPSVLEGMRASMRSMWPGASDIPTLFLFNIADVPFPRAFSDKDMRAVKAARAMPGVEEVVALQAGDPRLERGQKDDWLQLLGAAAGQVAIASSFSVLLVVHALRAPRSGVIPFYNLEFMRVLTEARLNIDTEVVLTWDGKDTIGRPPRKMTVGVHISGDGPPANIFTRDSAGIAPATGILTLPKAKGPDDYMKVQNVTAIRETDVADSTSLSSIERAGILGNVTLKSLMRLAQASLPALATFKAELLAPPKRRGGKCRMKAEGAKVEDGVKDEDLDEGRDEDDDEADEETPLKARRGAAAAVTRGGSLAVATPMLVVALGVANGNIAVAAVDHVIESNLHAHVLNVDASKTACEFAQQRVEKKIYTEWHQGRLDWNGRSPVKARNVTTGAELKFDAAPLVIRNGRLHIPDRLLEEFVGHEATEDMVAELVEQHALKFHTGDYTMTRLDQAKLGLATDPQPGSADAATSLPDPVVTSSDPTDQASLELLPHCQWAAGHLVAGGSHAVCCASLIGPVFRS